MIWYDQHPGAMSTRLGHAAMPSHWGQAKDGMPVMPFDETWRWTQDGDLAPTSYAQWMKSQGQWQKQFDTQNAQWKQQFDENRRRYDDTEGRRKERFGMFKEALVGDGPVSQFMNSGFGTSMSSKSSLGSRKSINSLGLMG